jgi:hypothetical protein
VTGPLRLALVPLDERPVNTGLVRDVAAIAGCALDLPPADLLPRFRAAGDVKGIAAWLRGLSPELDGAVISIDTLVHGGLIPSRTSHEPISTVVGRLEVLREIHGANPRMRIAAVSLVMRASDSYSAVEEPEYWAQAGREVHALGGAVHWAWAGTDTVAEPALPEDIRRDYSGRRLRNHVVNLAALDLAWEGVVDPLVITADDTAAWSAGSAEQRLIEYWQQLRGEGSVQVYPGADETGAVLVARLLASGDSPRVFVMPSEAEGMERIPSYENVPLRESLVRQLAAVGAVAVPDASDADFVLVIHTPDPAGADHFGGDPVPDHAVISSTVAAVGAAIEAGRPAVLADLRYGNGGDIDLIDVLAADGLLSDLDAYSGWNTAGNALGSALALGVAAVVGRREGTLDDGARIRALKRRLLDDAVYQARVRREVSLEFFGHRIEPVDAERAARAEAVITEILRDRLAALNIRGSDRVASVTLPWLRSFEIDVLFEGEPV